MRTIVYVDGLNLYHRALRGTPYRWLNIRRLCEALLPRDDIVRIRYYTSLLSSRIGDPDRPVRQQFYLRALRTIPNLSIHLGRFLTHVVRMPLARDPSRQAEVIRTDEKGTDVNLASHLILDAMKGEFDAAAVVSNDSDLAEPLRIVRREIGKAIGVLCPTPQPSPPLLRQALFFKPIRAGVLAASQFPPMLQDLYGVFHKPNGW